MDFAALPPEINSARMYTGPGSAPMMAAASAWNALGAELAEMASSYSSVITALSGEEWHGSASTAMATAVAPYVAWMNATAAAADHAASQAMASAAAFESAFAMTVPPPTVAANRAQLAALVSANILGQNTPAIAATEALYSQMWAQDASAMYGYAAASAAAGVLQPLVAPEAVGNAVAPAGASAETAQDGLSQLVTALPNVVQQLASPLAGSGAAAAAPPSDLGSFLLYTVNSMGNIGLWDGIQEVTGTAGNMVAWNLFSGITTAIGLAAPGPAAISGAGTVGLGGTVLAHTAPPAAAPAAAPATAGSAVFASIGQASASGGLSVPAGWSAAVPATSGAAVPGEIWPGTVDEDPAVTALPAGMAPMTGSGGGAGLGLSAPRYGSKPVVMQRPVMVG